VSDAYRLQELTAASVRDIESLFADVFTNEPWNDDWSDPSQLSQYLMDVIGNPNSLSLGMYSGDRLVAISLGSIIHWYTGTEYYIRELCVARDLQGRGVGRDFLERIEGLISRRGVRAIILSTDTDAPAYAFYRKNGFAELEKARFLHKAIGTRDAGNA